MLAVLAISLQLSAARTSAAAGPAPGTADPGAALADLKKRFNGAFRCNGHFANGRSITSSESFAPLLQGQWLAQEHVDDAPFSYAAQRCGDGTRTPASSR